MVNSQVPVPNPDYPRAFGYLKPFKKTQKQHKTGPRRDKPSKAYRDEQVSKPLVAVIPH